MVKGVDFMKKANITKLFAVLLTLSVITALALPSFAAKSVKVKLDISGEKGKVYVRLTAPAESDIATMSSALKFDTEKLTFDRISYLTDKSIVSMTKDVDASKGEVTANIVFADSLTEESKIFTYIFDVKDGAEGEIAFDFTKIEATDSKNEKINITFDGAKTAVIAELAPPTPDVTQSGFEAPTEIKPAPTESETETEPAKNTDNPKIPPTSGKIIAASAVSIAVLAGIAGATAYTVKRRKEEK